MEGHGPTHTQKGDHDDKATPHTDAGPVTVSVTDADAGTVTDTGAGTGPGTDPELHLF